MESRAFSVTDSTVTNGLHENSTTPRIRGLCQVSVVPMVQNMENSMLLEEGLTGTVAVDDHFRISQPRVTYMTVVARSVLLCILFFIPFFSALVLKAYVQNKMEVNRHF
jgi:hypothetical protein